MFTDYFNE